MYKRYTPHSTSARQEIKHCTHCQGLGGAHTAVQLTIQSYTMGGRCNGKTVTPAVWRCGALAGGSIDPAPISGVDWARSYMYKHLTHRQGPCGAHTAVTSRPIDSTTLHMACVTVKPLQTVRGGVCERVGGVREVPSVPRPYDVDRTRS